MKNELKILFVSYPGERLYCMIAITKIILGCKQFYEDFYITSFLGGYERGECLRSAEMFNIQDNAWTSLPPMKVARGRVAVAVLNNKLYACGGSDGHHELRSVECYDTETNKWSFVADMQMERSCPGK